MRNIALYLLSALAGMALVACSEKSKPTGTAQPVEPSTPAFTGSSSWIHWLGRKQLETETNAAVFMSLWSKPESEALQAHVLDRLSTAPWRLLPQAATTNSAAAQWLRPLLEDLVQEESYLELSHPSNRHGEFILAVRLDPSRAHVWETNLAGVMESLTGIQPGPAAQGGAGWSLRKDQMPGLIELTRAGDWTVLGIGQGTNDLLAEVEARIQKDGAPFARRATNFWIEARLNLEGVARVLFPGWKAPENLPGIAFHAIGDGLDVRSRGSLSFPNALEIDLKPWRLPINLIREPYIGFSAIRGTTPLFEAAGNLMHFPTNRIPGQFFVWHDGSTPFNAFFAWPTDRPVEDFNALAPAVTNWIVPRLGINAGALAVDQPALAVRWTSLPMAMPFFQAVTNPGSQFLFGGFGPPLRVGPNASQALIRHLEEGTNLVYFDWELTGQRFTHWRYLEDVTRILFDVRGPILPAKTPSLQWTASIRSNLLQCVTEVKLLTPNQLSFARRSTIGLTAAEINFLAGWIEFPPFPGGMRNLLITNDFPVLKRQPLIPLPDAASLTNAPRR